MKKTLFIIMSLFSILYINIVYAEDTCSYKEEVELRQKASNIRAIYEIEEKVYSEAFDHYAADIGNVFKISIMNITDEFYVEASNSYNGDNKIFTSASVVDGINVFEWEYDGVVTTHTFTIKASDKTNCQGKTVGVFRLVTPRFNDFYYQCADEFPEYSLCQKFVTFDKMENAEFTKRINAYRETQEKYEIEENKTFITKILNFLNRYKWIIIGVVIVCGAGAGTYYYLVLKKQRDKEI